MLCEYCGKNEATQTYERIKGKKVESYCMTCYERLFLSGETYEGEGNFIICPYCDMTLEEFQKTKLVGCAHCYTTMKKGIYATLKKMQGDRPHTGKTPPLSLDGDIDLSEFDKEEQARKMQTARYEKQCNELELIITKLKAENNYEDAKDYADKLSVMRSNSEIEEEFVWRTRTLSKQR